jgi:hypothetical protein
MGALRSLLERAERELTREPDAYVAVAVVGSDRREVQVGRWRWSGVAGALQGIGPLGPKVGAEDRGLRVRVHHGGGGLVGSVLLRRLPTAPPKGGRPARPAAEPGVPTEVEADRFSGVEARLAMALAAVAAQGRELAALRAELAGLRTKAEVLEHHEDRLAEVEAVVERVRDAEAALAERWGRPDEGDEDE